MKRRSAVRWAASSFFSRWRGIHHSWAKSSFCMHGMQETISCFDCFVSIWILISMPSNLTFNIDISIRELFSFPPLGRRGLHEGLLPSETDYGRWNC